MKNNVLMLLLGCFVFLSNKTKAQESNTVFNFLELPTSAHATALGGKNISLIDDDASLVHANPALLSSVSDKTMNFNFMTYLQGSKVASAGFVKIAGERSTYGITAQYANYGSMKETTVDNQITGEFTPMDMALCGMYAYNLNDYWAGGVTGKFIYSKYSEFTSVGLAVDLGLNYYNDRSDFSFSIVAKNLGGQVKAFGDNHEKIPFSLQAGITKKMAHAPFRISVTLTDLNRWDKKYFYIVEDKLSTTQLFMNHLAAGVDFLPTDNIYLALGYNFRKAYEMKAAGSSHAAGITAGGGINLSRFQFGFAYAQYHLSAPSLVFNLGYRL